MSYSDEEIAIQVLAYRDGKRNIYQYGKPMVNLGPYLLDEHTLCVASRLNGEPVDTIREGIKARIESNKRIGPNLLG